MAPRIQICYIIEFPMVHIFFYYSTPNIFISMVIPIILAITKWTLKQAIPWQHIATYLLNAHMMLHLHMRHFNFTPNFAPSKVFWYKLYTVDGIFQLANSLQKQAWQIILSDFSTVLASLFIKFHKAIEWRKQSYHKIVMSYILHKEGACTYIARIYYQILCEGDYSL